MQKLLRRYKKIKNKNEAKMNKAQLSVEFLLSFLIVLLATSLFLALNIDIKTYNSSYDIALAKAGSCYLLSVNTKASVLCIGNRSDNGFIQEKDKACEKSNILD